MNNCPHCGQAIRAAKPKAARFADPLPDPNRPGWWLYTNAKGETYGSTVFLSGKARAEDARRRARMALRYGTAARSTVAYDWLPLYLKHLPETIPLEKQAHKQTTISEDETWEDYQVRRAVEEQEIEEAKRQLAVLKLKIFRSERLTP